MEDTDLDIISAALEQRLRTALAEFSGDEALQNVDPHDSLSEVLDSLGHFTFLLSLEQIFQVEIPDDKFSFASMGTLDGVRKVLLECSSNHQEPDDFGQ